MLGSERRKLIKSNHPFRDRLPVLSGCTARTNKAMDLINVQDTCKQLSQGQMVLNVNEAADPPRWPDDIMVSVGVDERRNKGGSVTVADQLSCGSSPLALVPSGIPEMRGGEEFFGMVAESDGTTKERRIVMGFWYGN
jgi:hypothetical protein